MNSSKVYKQDPNQARRPNTGSNNNSSSRIFKGESFLSLANFDTSQHLENDSVQFSFKPKINENSRRLAEMNLNDRN
jgi:hypothetical protein